MTEPEATEDGSEDDDVLYESPPDTTDLDADAAEFGKHFRQGGWRLGWLVARNCKRGQGKRTDLATGGEVEDDRVSCEEFAKRAGVSASTVKYYFRAWELAADDTVCTRAAELDSTAGPTFDEGEDQADWSKYYKKARNQVEKESAPTTSGNQTQTRKKRSGTTTPKSDDNVDHSDDNEPIYANAGMSNQTRELTQYRSEALVIVTNLQELRGSLNDVAEHDDQRKIVSEIREAAAKVVATADELLSEMSDEEETSTESTESGDDWLADDLSTGGQVAEDLATGGEVAESPDSAPESGEGLE